ncbi:MAG: GNAT family N-acetyltransferase [Jatrophihabitans sp.]
MPHVVVTDAAATQALRRSVLRAEQPAGDGPAPGDAPDAIHVAAFDGAEVIGAAALLPRPFPLRPQLANVLQLRGMAVSPARRGEGIGALVLAGVLGIARSRGDDLLWCNARSTALGFYTRLGLIIEGEEFASPETGLPHRLMWRSVQDSEPGGRTTSSEEVQAGEDGAVSA